MGIAEEGGRISRAGRVNARALWPLHRHTLVGVATHRFFALVQHLEERERQQRYARARGHITTLTDSLF